MIRRRLATFAVAVLAFAFVAGACGDDGGDDDASKSTDDTTETTDSTEGSSDSTESTNTPADQLNVQVAEHPEYGEILVTSEGHTLYVYAPDDAGDPTCTGECNYVWPAYPDDGDISPHPLGRSRFGVVMNGDVEQVTFDKWPLYTYPGDREPGATNGHTYDGEWFIMGVDGPIGVDD